MIFLENRCSTHHLLHDMLQIKTSPDRKLKRNYIEESSLCEYKLKIQKAWESEKPQKMGLFFCMRYLPESGGKTNTSM